MRRTLGRQAVVALALALSTGCAVVKMTRLRPDYEAVDRQRVKRLVVVTQPLPEGKQAVGELWSQLARKYVNLKRDFIVKENRAVEGTAFDAKAQCAQGEALEGVLWLKPDVQRKGNGVEASVNARLFRCSDGEEVWAADGGGSWSSADPKMAEVTAYYVNALGAEVEPYVAPSQHLLAAVLDTLPQPVLTEEDKDEKVTID